MLHIYIYDISSLRVKEIYFIINFYWFLTLRGENWSIVFGSWKIFGPKRKAITADWSKVHKDLEDLYSSPNCF